MDFLLLGRIAKVVALLGFLLPWVTVSCSNQPLLEATGVQLMTGDIQPVTGQGQQQSDADPYLIAIAAFAAILIGLVVAMSTRGKNAAAALIAGGLAGAGLSYFAVENIDNEIARNAENQSAEAARQMAAMLQVQPQEGYWVTLAALIAAAILGALVLAQRDPAPPG